VLLAFGDAPPDRVIVWWPGVVATTMARVGWQEIPDAPAIACDWDAALGFMAR
jgi:hypothetical protein